MNCVQYSNLGITCLDCEHLAVEFSELDFVMPAIYCEKEQWGLFDTEITHGALHKHMTGAEDCNCFTIAYFLR